MGVETKKRIFGSFLNYMENKRKILEYYLTALEEALKNDDHNKGFHIDGPDKCVKKEYTQDVDGLLEEESNYRCFFDLVGVYFDAKSHYATEINGKNIEEVKNEIEKQILEIRSLENM